jgi:hypothetical protein
MQRYHVSAVLLRGLGAGGAARRTSALRERRHRGLARLGVAVRRRAILVMTEGERPHPRLAYRRRVHLQDPADDNAVGEYVEVIVVPLARWPAAEARLRTSREDMALTCGGGSCKDLKGSFVAIGRLHLRD